MTADGLQRSRVQNGYGSFEPLPESFTDATITSRFSSIAARYPRRIAAVDRNSQLTYKQLDQESNRLAETINNRCGDRPRPIALLLPQGVPAVIATIGTLKARMFYVPCDCAAQEVWLREVLSEVQPAIILSDADNMTLARSIAPPGITVMDVCAPGSPSPNDEAYVRKGVADDIAYVFFTSGTTGRPKGVFDTHRNVLHNVLRYTNALAIRRDDRVSLLQSPAFSGTVSSLFCALLNGACVFPVDIRRESMGTLASWLQEQAITIYHSVPAIFRGIADGDREFSSIRIVRLEGDRGSKRDLQRFRRHFPDESMMVNGLGTTETGLVSQFFMDRTTCLTGETLPVGYPSTDMQVSIVGEDGDKLPTGSVGEIVVTSRYLAAGYWRRPDLTAAAFETPSTDPTQRSYRTGDLGRIAEDGSLEHLGRVDSKIRLHGQWVVPAVVEEVLVDFAGVDEAAVGVTGDIGNESLVAYLKYGDAEQPDVGTLREHLVARVPIHSVPARFVSVHELPVTAYGKIDRSALPDHDRIRPKLSTPYVAACGVLQQQLVELWQDVLNLDEVGIRDDFFALGGDSLLAVQLLTGLELLIEHTVPPDILLGAATIENMADVLLQHEDFRTTTEVFNAGGKLQPLFFLHGDYLSGGTYVHELARKLGPARPVVSIRPCGLAGDPVPTSYSEMAEIHLEQIRAVQPVGPYLLGGNCNGGLVAFEIAQLLTKRGEEVVRVVMIDASASNLKYERLYNRFALRAVKVLDPKLAESAFLYIRGQLEWIGHNKGNGRVKLLFGRLAKKIVSPRQGRSWARDAITTGTPNQSVAGYWARLRPIYQRIDHLYFPKKYRGPVVVLWPQASPGESLSNARYWWERICAQISMMEIPGDNVTCLTGHVDALARTLAEALEGR